VPSWEREISDLWAALFVPASAVIGTIGVILLALTRFKDKRMEGALEASTTWRELAQSREATNVDLERKAVSRDRYIQRLERQNSFLWDQLAPEKREEVSRKWNLRE